MAIGNYRNVRIEKDLQHECSPQHDCSGHVTLGNSKWIESKLLPGMTAEIDTIATATTNTSGAFGGTYVPVPTSATPTIGTIGINPNPNTIGPGFGVIQSSFGFPPVVEEEPDECEDGHFIDQKTVRTFVEDGDDQITGQCLFCGIVIYLPELEGTLAFERAGKAVGRAMTLEDGDGENVGELLADVNRIERDLKAEMMKFKRALGMLDIARDLIEERVCA